MKHKRITIFTALIFAILFFGYLPAVLAAPTAQLLDYFVFLPIMVKPALLTPNSTNTSTSTPTLTPTPTNTSTSTPTLTPTPTNTSTPTPTLTPTPTATSILPGVQFLTNQSHYVDSYSWWHDLHVVGEIRNNTANNLSVERIAVNFFNASGQLLEIDISYIYLDNLPAGDRTCFEFALPEPAGWAYYEFETPTYTTNNNPLPNLTILNDNGSYNPTDGGYKILGFVRNDYVSRVENVFTVGTLYNASGTVVGCNQSYVSSTYLDPGQTSSFKMGFGGRDYADVTLYRLQVAGTP
jgi:hypothetical protein